MQDPHLILDFQKGPPIEVYTRVGKNTHILTFDPLGGRWVTIAWFSLIAVDSRAFIDAGHDQKEAHL